ncbi:HAD-IIIA family hydrolase [Pseudidiomarina terrestris]|uniref:HAD-IIIA family hydrolase n=1 Tax=Pseudidiomarina terrestris TaxID=2820060 RepID=A0AAW7QXQ7_9GAMM|nr:MULTISPECIES: HAD-IIIA family hydrolase [unclassified Pseudidiomarina]MDN7123630.1 HAD-IIIA family hydrolase [Pseudidiomarina sp. 1APP75-32.1]MDN7126580.1 HAD-IIIA family hydrolase [Pseudidiomarina sp. 1APR75-33.1]MDN7135095.1 HAD-IIIA family hydrolase [Pseudidiomarina sp. 1ASP75-5]MDN7137766.1 HAD-IIIA family hydrolase [Pseudidiomarina sp. 1ASP75-14]MEA3587126.1 HAD-IIIA family hydrolase [Pseudidiomarina sp. 1APP75-27a]
MKYQLLIFDWDGTLMDSIGRIVSSMQATATHLALPVPTDTQVRDIIGLSLEPAIERLFGRLDGQQHATFLARYRDQYVELDPTPTPLFAGVPEMLADLRQQGYQLAVATGKARRGLNRVWQETDTAQFFQLSRCADESASKPDPKMLHELLEEANCDLSKALMIGDSIHDLRMAEAAGMDRVGVDFGVHSAQQLSVYSPLAVLSNWQQFPSLLDAER